MDTGTIATRPASEDSLESVLVLEEIPHYRDDAWEPYVAELRAIFGFDPGSDPDPSEWFAPDEFSEFRPYLETVRRARRSSMLADAALVRRRVLARDIVGRDRATRDHEQATRERDAARAQQRRLDRAGLGQIRLRAEDRLGFRRRGLALPSDLRFSREQATQVSLSS